VSSRLSIITTAKWLWLGFVSFSALAPLQAQDLDTAYYFKRLKQSTHADTIAGILTDFGRESLSHSPKIIFQVYIRLLDLLLINPNHDTSILTHYFGCLKQYFYLRQRNEDYLDFIEDLKKKPAFSNPYVRTFVAYEEAMNHYFSRKYSQTILKMNRFIEDSLALKFPSSLYLNGLYTIGDCHLILGNTLQTENYLRKCLQEAIRLNNLDWVALAHGNLGKFLYKIKHLKKEGKKHLFEDLRFSKQINYRSGICSVFSFLFDANMEDNDLKTAKTYLDSLFFYSQTAWGQNNNDSALRVREFHFRNVKYFLKSSGQEKVFESFSHFNLLNDQANQRIRDHFIKESAAINENNKKVVEISKLNADLEIKQLQRNFLLVVLSLGFAFGALMVYLFLDRIKKYHQLQTQIGIINKQKQEIADQNQEIESQNENLNKINQSKDRLFSIISHDLRGPVGTLKSLFELLQSQYITQHEFNQMAPEVKSNVDNLYLNLEQLLQWSHSQLKGIRPNSQVFDLGLIVSQLIELYQPMAKEKGVVLQLKSSKGVEVCADPDHIKLILRNLISNSIKFSKRNTWVRLGWFESEQKVQVYIQDQGEGMSQQDIDAIFSGQMIHSKHGTNGEKGTGLGLSLCKEFVEANGGELNIESSSGKGTNVSFTLPKA
jgi:signal transduction histidine kinase